MQLPQSACFLRQSGGGGVDRLSLINANKECFVLIYAVRLRGEYCFTLMIGCICLIDIQGILIFLCVGKWRRRGRAAKGEPGFSSRRSCFGATTGGRPWTLLSYSPSAARKTTTLRHGDHTRSGWRLTLTHLYLLNTVKIGFMVKQSKLETHTRSNNMR
jgi:hypothetical protein